MGNLPAAIKEPAVEPIRTEQTLLLPPKILLKKVLSLWANSKYVHAITTSEFSKAATSISLGLFLTQPPMLRGGFVMIEASPPASFAEAANAETTSGSVSYSDTINTLSPGFTL